jgi:hypothetical protein
MATTQAVQPTHSHHDGSNRWDGGADPNVPRVPADAIEHTIRHATLRGVGFVGLLGVALIHLLDVVGKMSETPYLGVMYIGLMVASVIVAFALLHTGRPIAWLAAGVLAGLTLIGFILSRTTGLPSSTDDVGNWKEGLGLASMFVETGMILLSAYALALAHREQRPGVHVAIPIKD